VSLEPPPEPDLDRLDRSAQFPGEQRDRLEKTAVNPLKSRDARAEAFGNLGMLYHAYALSDAALTCYGNARALVPGDYRWPYLCGALLRDMGRDEEAEEAFRAASARNDAYAPIPSALGELAFEAGHYAEARAFFERALALDPEQPAALAGLGQVAQATGRSEEAVDYYMRALKRDPQATALHYRLALAYRSLNRREDAERHIAQRGEGRPSLADPLLAGVNSLRSDAEALRRKGDDAVRAGRLGEAARHYETAANVSPDDARVWNNLGWTRLQLNDYAGAKAAFEQVLDLNQGPALDAAAHFWLGDLAERSAADGSSHYRAAVAANPHHARAAFRLAEHSRATGDWEAALAGYRQALENDPALTPARLGRALALIRLERWEEALANLAQDQRAAPDQPAFVHFRARILAACPRAELRDGAEALRLADALRPAMDNADLEATKAMALAEMGRYGQAIMAQSKAIAKALAEEQPLAWLQRNLLRYRDGQPCEEPWPADDPLFTRRLY